MTVKFYGTTDHLAPHTTDSEHEASGFMRIVLCMHAYPVVECQLCFVRIRFHYEPSLSEDFLLEFSERVGITKMVEHPGEAFRYVSF